MRQQQALFIDAMSTEDQSQKASNNKIVTVLDLHRALAACQTFF
jgi:hypothetical protein